MIPITLTRSTARSGSAIRHEEWCRDNASPDDLHFWDGWTPEKVRTGQLLATVTTSAPGNGYTVVVVATLIVQVDGKAVAYVPGTEKTERVDSRIIRRAGGLEAYGRKLATNLYGADFPVKCKHHA